ncbi:DnaJ-domain-containing protein [Stipitochalara longipes BDJ]|nr:DnaJ-domain-containing protein [Stipitochalara longipes BDJ]
MAKILSMENCHELLGLIQGCTEVEIKYAYKRCALMYHPDKNGGSKLAEEKFKQINNAYEILIKISRGSTNSAKPQPQTQQPRQHPSRGPRGGIARPSYPRGFALYTERTFIEHALVILKRWERANNRKDAQAEKLRTLIDKNLERLETMEKVWYMKQSSRDQIVELWRGQGRASRLMMEKMDELDRIMREREE